RPTDRLTAVVQPEHIADGTARKSPQVVHHPTVEQESVARAIRKKGGAADLTAVIDDIAETLRSPKGAEVLHDAAAIQESTLKPGGCSRRSDYLTAIVYVVGDGRGTTQGAKVDDFVETAPGGTSTERQRDTCQSDESHAEASCSQIYTHGHFSF